MSDDTSEYENCVFCSLHASKTSHDTGTKLDALNDNVTGYFKDISPITSFYLYEQRQGHYMASVLFKKDKDISSFEKSGSPQKLADYVYAELERAGFGSRNTVSVRFRFESSESLDSPNGKISIPTDEDFARADRLEQERSRNLDRVSETVKKHFMNLCPLHNVYILWQTAR
ncbi:MAG TPA: hypothetical protein VFE24_01800 [Pirellulales bacterium]|nr:hypothetical protein [Pirellulales bacterium]